MQRFGQAELSQYIGKGFIALAIAALLSGADFPQWRGPNRDGVISGAPAGAWPERLKQVWKITVGEGHSSPVVVGSRVYQHARLDDKEVIGAYDLTTGKKLWEQSYSAANYKMNPAAIGHGRGPKSTPVVANGKLFTFGIAGALTCLDAASGKVLWQLATQAYPDFGTAMSPVTENGVVYVHLASGGGSLAAIDVASGKPKWQWKEDGPAYSSPALYTLAGTRQLITQTRENLVSIDAGSGQTLWKVPFQTSFDQNSVTPFVHGDLVIYSGVNQPAIAIRPAKTASGWSTPKIWETREAGMYMSSPVLSSGILWGFAQRNKGQFFGVDPKTGKVLWTGPGRQAENAALLTQGDLLFALTTESDLIVFRTGNKGLIEQRRYKVADSPAWAHPAIVGNKILIKDAQTLALWSAE